MRAYAAHHLSMQECQVADAAIFIGWGQVARGSEAKAMDLFNDAAAYYIRLQQAGVIESFEPVILSPHGGDLSGFIMLRGDRAKLDALKGNEEFIRLNSRASMMLDNLGVIDAQIGASLAASLAIYSSLLG